MAFDPNRLTFEDGVKLIDKARQKAELSTNKILTSRDKEARDAIKLLEVKNVPDGFTKWMLPIYLTEHSQQYFSYAAPGTKVPRHSHDEGDGIRVILHGTIVYNGIELGQGDWMYIPKGKAYDFTVGPQGVGMFYCYCCCCGGAK
jgi:hypothetical protein